MKAGSEHRVPLSDRALEILAPLPREKGNPHVFIGARKGKGLSDMAMLELLRGMDGSGYTVHGFRSSFRDWCAEQTNYPRELAEAALAHVLKDKTEAAYRRGDLFEKRRKLMRAWASYCASPPRAHGRGCLFDEMEPMIPATLLWNEAVNWMVTGEVFNGDPYLRMALNGQKERMSVDDAEAALRDRMESGEGVATGCRRDAIDLTNSMTHRRDDIPTNDWPDLRVNHDTSFAARLHESIPGQGYADVRLRRQDVEAAFAAAHGAEPTKRAGLEIPSTDERRPRWRGIRRHSGTARDEKAP